jgi:hypothetical protein
MTFKRTHSITASALLLASTLLGHTDAAHAGNLSNAQLGCYVDTYAFDYPTIGSCYSVWIPNGASNPSAAVFEIQGLPAGSYTFTWIDYLSGQSGVCSSAYSGCVRTIEVNQTIGMAVIVTDTQTGESTVLYADASFYDGYT